MEKELFIRRASMERACPQCTAGPGRDCVGRIGAQGQLHARRTDKGLAAYRKAAR